MAEPSSVTWVRGFFAVIANAAIFFGFQTQSVLWGVIGILGGFILLMIAFGSLQSDGESEQETLNDDIITTLNACNADDIMYAVAKARIEREELREERY